MTKQASIGIRNGFAYAQVEISDAETRSVTVPLNPKYELCHPNYWAACLVAAGKALGKLEIDVDQQLDYTVMALSPTPSDVRAPLTLTRAQADEFLNKAFGFRTLGVADDQEVVEAWSPALRSFFIGVTGQQPAVYSGITPRDKRATTAALLRAVADALEPQQGGEKE